jgi:hypothetical protein
MRLRFWMPMIAAAVLALGGCSDGQRDPATDRGLINNPPVPISRTVYLDEDIPTSITLEATDVDGDDLRFTITQPPQHGRLAGTPSQVVYHPDLNYNGTDGFSFSVNDGQVDSLSEGVISLVIRPINDQPVANDLNVSLDEDTPVEIDLNATDVDGDDLNYTITVPPAHGTIEGNGAHRRYVPDQDYYGSDRFVYRASDGELYNEANVTLAIHSVNDAPVANDDNATTDQNITLVINVLANDTDVEGDDLTLVEVNTTANATAAIENNQIVYHPNLMFFGTDTLSYRVEDIYGDGDEGNVTITVRERPYVTALSIALSRTSANLHTDIAATVTAAWSNGTHTDVTDRIELHADPASAVSISGRTIHTERDHTTPHITATLTNWLGQIITSPAKSLSIYWEVDGHRLPPEPDPSTNNATLHGIDSNGDGVRDDVERYIYRVESTHPRYPRTNIALSMQFAKAFLEIIDDPTFEKHKTVDKFVTCQYYFIDKHTQGMSYKQLREWESRNLSVSGVVLEDAIFNTRERILRRFDFLQTQSGHLFLPIKPDKHACETDIDALGE